MSDVFELRQVSTGSQLVIMQGDKQVSAEELLVLMANDLVLLRKTMVGK